MFDWLASPEGRLVVAGLFSRGVGVAIVVALGSLWGQLLPMLGERGIQPAQLQLDAMRRYLPWRWRLWLNPSLLWIASSDRALQSWLALGILCGVGLVVGGPWTPWCALVAWLVWLSFDRVLFAHYPWDNLLKEVLFLAAFLPATRMLPALSSTQLPAPLVVFALHLLLFRVLFGFGKLKFWGIERRDWVYTRYFLLNMPIVSKVGWYVAKLPRFVHRAGLAFVAFVELVCPFLLFVPGPARLVAVAAVLAQMVGIQLTGSFGYFNLLCAVLCIAALDPVPHLGTALAAPPTLFTFVFLALLPAWLAWLVFNNWFNYGWLHWPNLRRSPALVRAFLAWLRVVEPFRLAHAYGVFRPHPAPPVRWVTVVEGTQDGTTWRPYRWRFNQTDETSAPRFVAPYHPRLDHIAFYDGVGVDGAGWFHVLSFDTPFLFTDASVLERAAQRLMEPGNAVRRLFASDPFGGAAPSAVRVSVFRFVATSLEEHRRTGRWYSVERIGNHLPAAGPDPTRFSQWQRPPELWHPEAATWRARARSVDGITDAELARFTDELLPALRVVEPTWAALPDVAIATRRRWSRDELWSLHLTLGRLTTFHLARLDAVFRQPASHFARDVLGIGAPAGWHPDDLDPVRDPEAALQALAAWPDGPLRSPFHLQQLVHQALLERGPAALHSLTGGIPSPGARIATVVRPNAKGMAAIARELGVDVPQLLSLARTLDLERAMFVEGVLGYDLLARHSARLALLYSSSDAYEPVPTGIVPGAFDLAQALVAGPRLPMLEGWGSEVRALPVLDPPRMHYDEAGEWLEVPRSSFASSQADVTR